MAHCGKGLISVFRQFASTGKIFILAGRLGTGVFEGVPKAGLDVFWCGMLAPVGGSEGLAVAKVVGGIGFGGSGVGWGQLLAGLLGLALVCVWGGALRGGGLWAIILFALGTFLMFPNFLSWYAFSCLASRQATRIYCVYK